MRTIVVFVAAACLAAAQTPAGAVAAPANTTEAKPAERSESLHYDVTWPSGLSLGEATLTSKLDNGAWRSSFTIEAALPGFALSETARSSATPDYCSLELEKSGERGSRKVGEKVTFNQKNGTATRQTSRPGGGKSEIKVASCAKDALAFVAFLRRELAAGRLPQAQPVYYGAAYQVRAQFMGTQSLRFANEIREVDRIQANIKGAAGEVTLEMYFARDEVRTPLRIVAPLAMGKFSMELSR